MLPQRRQAAARGLSHHATASPTHNFTKGEALIFQTALPALFSTYNHKEAVMFIGFTLLEKLIAQLKPEQTLYLNFLEELIPGGDGIDLLRCYLLLQADNPDGQQQETVLYWRMIIGELLAPGGSPWEHEHAAARKVGLSARLAVKRFLGGQPNIGRIEESAVIAMPRDLKLTAGTAQCLSFDRTTQTYRLKELTEAPTTASSPA
jgi:hypothetical protein